MKFISSILGSTSLIATLSQISTNGTNGVQTSTTEMMEADYTLFSRRLSIRHAVCSFLAEISRGRRKSPSRAFGTF